MKKVYLFTIGLLVSLVNSSEASTIFFGDSTIKSDSTYFIQSEEQPIFPGGDKAFINFIKYHSEYPRDAKENGIQGRVIVSFIIEKDGSVSNAKVERGIGFRCDEEALRVVNKLPKYIPGKQNGLPVRVQVLMPINFILSE